jgi:hypothetical protein
MQAALLYRVSPRVMEAETVTDLLRWIGDASAGMAPG